MIENIKYLLQKKVIEKVPVRIVKNIVLFILIIIFGIRLFGVYNDILDNILEQQKEVTQTDTISLGAGVVSDKNFSRTSMEEEVVVEIEEDEEVVEDQFIPISISKLYYLRAILFCLLVGVCIAYIIISKFNKYSFGKTFRGVLRKVLLGVITVLFTSVSSVLFILNIEESVNDLNKENKITLEENSKIKIDSVKESDKDESEKYEGTFKSVVSDECVFVAKNGGIVEISSGKIDKSGIDGFNVSYSRNYGVNSAVLAYDGGKVNIDSSNIYADSKGASGLFSKGKKSEIGAKSVNLQILGRDSAYGLVTTYDGKIDAKDIDIVTDGKECSAILSGRKGGKITVNKANIKTYGDSAPILYAKNEVVLKEVKAVTRRSNLIVTEDNANVVLDYCNMSGLLGGYNSGDESCVYIHSKSDDYDKKKAAKLKINNSYLCVDRESEFYATAPLILVNNQEVSIELINNEIQIGSRVLLDARCMEKYGEKARNGGHVKLKTDGQRAVGFIKVDKYSTLDMNMTNNSKLVGAINYENTGTNKAKLVIDRSSSLVLTSNCYLTNFENEDETNSNITFGRYNIYVNGNPVN